MIVDMLEKKMLFLFCHVHPILLASPSPQTQYRWNMPGFYSRIRQSFVRPNDHQKDMDDLAREVERVQTEYSVIIDSWYLTQRTFWLLVSFWR